MKILVNLVRMTIDSLLDGKFLRSRVVCVHIDTHTVTHTYTYDGNS